MSTLEGGFGWTRDESKCEGRRKERTRRKKGEEGVRIMRERVRKKGKDTPGNMVTTVLCHCRDREYREKEKEK